MQTPFVVIPVMPQEKEQFSRRIGVPAALDAGYVLYDTHGKTRLALNCPTRPTLSVEAKERQERKRHIWEE